MRRIWILILCAAFIGCGDDDDPTGPTQGGSIYPLAVGNTWVYEETDFDSLGNITALDTFSMILSQDTVIEGETWYVMLRNGTDIGYCTSRSNGFYVGWPDEELMYKYPAQVGDQYMYDQQQAEVEDLAESVTVPAGHYTCIRYRFHIDMFHINVYSRVAVNIGPIWEELYYADGSLQPYLAKRGRLLSYSLQ